VFVDCGQELKQYRVDDHELVKAYLFDSRVYSVITSFDSKHSFAGLEDGSLKQICIDSQTVIKDYGKINNMAITTMALTRYTKFLVSSSYDNRLIKISIPNQKVVTGFDVNFPDWIVTMQVAPGDESLFLYDENCDLKLIHLTDGTTIHDFGRVHRGEVGGFQQMLTTRDGQYLFTSGKSHGLKQFSIRSRALVQSFGTIGGDIMFICD
jgi:hypothetical protein